MPDNSAWLLSTPIIEEDSKPHGMEIDTEHCGWYIRRYVDEPLPQSVIIYRDSDPTKKEAIGIGGEKALNEGKAAESIDLSQMFELFKEDPAYNGTV